MVKVYFTEMAYLQLLLEVKKYCGLETGAILVGQIIDGNYYVFESLDSGINCERSSVMFHRDNPYSEHLADVVRAKYRNAYAIGFWHRHPESFNQFSRDDKTANINMAVVLNRSIITGLVNIYEKSIGLKFWQVTVNGEYRDTAIIVGEKFFNEIVSYNDSREIEAQIIHGENAIYSRREAPLTSRRTAATQVQDEEQIKKKKEPLLNKVLGLLFNVENEYATNGEEIVEESISISILNIIKGDVEVLHSRYIRCQKYNNNDSAHSDKLFLKFINLTNDKSCDVVLFFKNNDLIFYVLNQQKKYKIMLLARNICSILEN